jgi:hypothetical protein
MSLDQCCWRSISVAACIQKPESMYWAAHRRSSVLGRTQTLQGIGPHTDAPAERLYS